jgi:SAM-dependent methyltransferase
MHEGPAMPAVEAGVEPSLAAELELSAVPHEGLVRRVRVLDVGYAFAEPAYLAALTSLRAPGLVAVDVAEAVVPGVTPVRANVRSLPFERNSFDVVLCISTLEHVGSDDDRYGRGLASGAVLCAELHPKTPANLLLDAIRRRRPPTSE